MQTRTLQSIMFFREVIRELRGWSSICYYRHYFKLSFFIFQMQFIVLIGNKNVFRYFWTLYLFRFLSFSLFLSGFRLVHLYHMTSILDSDWLGAILALYYYFHWEMNSLYIWSCLPVVYQSSVNTIKTLACERIILKLYNKVVISVGQPQWLQSGEFATRKNSYN